MPQRTHVFGDTGGHGRQLQAALTKLGLERTSLRLPDDVSIIHLGDLIHKGPHSNAIITLVDAIIKRNPGQWIQILGNHEAQHIPGAPRFWRCDCTPDTIDTINRWYATGQAVFAHGLASGADLTYPNKQSDFGLLFTHAGLTRQFWEGIGSPSDAEVAAAVINVLPIPRVTKAGMMLGEEEASSAFGEVVQVAPKPGPVWALSTFEVYQSWRAHARMPFVQVHGHTTAFSWMSRQWWPAPNGFVAHTTLDPEHRATFTQVAGSTMIGLDPGFSTRVDLPLQPSFPILTD